MKIGIISAMECEISEFIRNINITNITKLKKYKYYHSNFLEQELIIVKSGIGKILSSYVTTVLIEKFNVDIIINIGIVGKIDEKLKIFDVIFPKYTVQRDFDISEFGHKIGYIPWLNKRIFKCNEDVTRENLKDIENEYKKTIKNNKTYKILDDSLKQKIFSSKFKTGFNVSGDQFISSINDKNMINKNFKNVSICDMELSSITTVCYLSDIRIYSIKIISDNSDENSLELFKNFTKYSSILINILLKSTIKTILTKIKVMKTNKAWKVLN